MGNKGFSLVEVLVAGLITGILLLGIGAVFMGSMRAVSTGHRHMDAYETVRGAGAVVARDLSSVYTSRDHGDPYQFVGLPFGMSFIAQPNPVLGPSRVSYVVRQLSDDQDYPDRLDVIETIEGNVPAWVLIRYLENGVDRLDFYPFGWTREWWGLNAGADVQVLPEQVENLVSAVERTEAYADALGLTALAKADLVASIKRELFVRMLRGNGPVRTREGGWRPLSLVGEQLPDFFALMGIDPRDHVAATHISFSNAEINAAFALEEDMDLYPDPVAATGLLFCGMKAFDYGITAAATVKDPNDPDPALRPDPMPLSRREQQGFEGTAHVGGFQVSFRPFWNVAPQNLQAIDLELESPPESGHIVYPTPYGGEGSPLKGRIPETVHAKFTVRYPAPDVASRDVVKMFDAVWTCPAAYTPPQLSVLLR